MMNFFLDIPFKYQLFFQDTATPMMSGIIDLHQHVFFFQILILIVVSFQLFDILLFFRIDKTFTSEKMKKFYFFKALREEKKRRERWAKRFMFIKTIFHKKRRR